jgi:DNA-binding beta-propeller fold protein YncE
MPSAIFCTMVCVAASALAGFGGCRARSGESSDTQPPAHAGSAGQGPRSLRLVPSGGIGFDDLVYSSALHAVLAPAGATGCVTMFDSASVTKSQLCGLSTASGEYAGGHGEGTTSADIGRGLMFAVDRTSQSLKLADVATRQVLSASPLSGEPDYVRWVESKAEVWVTEPGQEQIEVFSLAAGDAPKLVRSDAIAVKGGPESLVIDATRGRAYSHLWAGSTVVVDVATHTVVESFTNGCKGSRGIALDPGRGFLFVGCSEGKAVVLDIDHGGRVLGSEPTPSGVDIVSANLQLNHLYVPAASDGSVSVFGVGTKGALTKLGALQAAPGAHCVASDDHARVWVCSPDQGALLVFDDTFSPTGE